MKIIFYILYLFSLIVHLRNIHMLVIIQQQVYLNMVNYLILKEIPWNAFIQDKMQFNKLTITPGLNRQLLWKKYRL